MQSTLAGSEASYCSKRIDAIGDLFGRPDARIVGDGLVVGNRVYPIIDDVVILLEPAAYPPSVRQHLAATILTPVPADFAPDVQETFGAEWQRFAAALPEYEREFAEYFDLVDLSAMSQLRVCDLGCGSGRWSLLVADRCREVVLVDFSDAIFVARENLRHVPNALFFMGDLTRLPFRTRFADLLFCLGVLHHLPVDALDQVRQLAQFADRLLIYLYYALDNRPAYFRVLLSMVTWARLGLCRIRNRRLRDALTWVGALGVYLPCLMVGRVLSPFGLSRFVPLYDEHHWVSIEGLRHHVYDRFFTRIEQRFSRAQILALHDTFARVTVSDDPGFWHFLCEGHRFSHSLPAATRSLHS